MGGREGLASCFHVGDSLVEVRGGLLCSQYVKGIGLCFSFLSRIARLGGCDVTGRILNSKTNSQIMLLS